MSQEANAPGANRPQKPAAGAETETRSGQGETVPREREETVAALDVAIREAVRARPYAALSLAAFAGFFWAIMRRP